MCFTQAPMQDFLEYAKIRAECLDKALNKLKIDDSIEERAKTMRTLSELYEQAYRVSSTNLITSSMWR